MEDSSPQRNRCGHFSPGVAGLLFHHGRVDLHGASERSSAKRQNHETAADRRWRMKPVDGFKLWFPKMMG